VNALSRIGSFKLELVAWFVLLALLPLVVAFYGYQSLARHSETRRVDTGLEVGLRAAVDAYGARLETAAAEARRLAREPRVQRALRTHDEAALSRLVPRARGPAAVRSVAVVDHGRLLGRVSVPVPIDDRLLASLGTLLAPGDRLVAAGSGRVVAGARRGEPLVVPAAPERVDLAGRSYRALATAPLREPPGLRLVALSPQAAIDAATGASERRILGALAASLLLFAIATYLLGRSVVGALRRLAGAADALARGTLTERVDVRGNDELAQLGRAFNRMASQLEQRLQELEAERVRARDSFARFGEALAATHEPAQLIQLVVESAVEATGAAGGAVLGPQGELARAGDPDAGDDRIALPLRAGASDFGLLVLTGAHFEASQVEAAVALTGQVAVALENARLHRIVEQQALLDSLTGLANRRNLEETLRASVARAVRFDDSVCLVLVDLDDFKLVNDRYGHAAGDEVLKQFASVLDETMREGDVAGRWGGEEFALVLGGTDLEGGVRLAERARSAVEGRPLLLPDGTELRVTASFGVAAFPDVPERDELLEAADAALYDAKRGGKNRVCRSVASAREEIV
jgi:diguanylate cyclase (GGDEF)-like protein